MDESDALRQIVTHSVEHWNKSFGGVSGLDISSKLGIPNNEVMSYMEMLADKGKGTLNRDVKLYGIRIDTENPKFEIPSEPTTTHVFFPAKEILSEHFYRSDLVRERHPEYKARLHLGAHQLELVFFSDEVLTRYFDHPEFYEIDDSLSGGTIWTKGDAPENRSLYVRYGKRKQDDGRLAVTAIYKDLYAMSAEEQRYWHAYEIEELSATKNDPNFLKFLARTYDGAFVKYPSPIKDIQVALESVNESFVHKPLFKRLANAHLRLPVENTKKALCDCCSELYKLIGPDSLDQKVMKEFLINELGVAETELIHAESERALNSMQLLELIEIRLGTESDLTKAIKAIGSHRIEADHKLIDEKIESKNYVDAFLSLCSELSQSTHYFAANIKAHVANT